MSKPIKVGVLGVGVLGYHHARLYAECEGAELVGIHDRNRTRLEEVASELNTRAFDDPDELAERVTAVSIAVPTNLHFEVGLAMLEKGKHLLIEKPITETVAQAETLLRHARKRGLIVQVGHVERFNPVISYLEQKIDNARFIESHRLSPYPPPRPGSPPRGTEVSVVLDLMIHDIDMVLNLTKSPVKQVEAVGIPVLSQTEDIANARITFENGCVANLTASRVTPEPMRKIRVFQKNTYLSLDYMAKTGEIFFRHEGKLSHESVPVQNHNALLKQLEHFVDCLARAEAGERRPTPKVSGEHGLQALKLADEITEVIRIVNPL